ncbi:chaperone DnaJ-domain superfamily protein [Actinidia rufa]|uniref:Chaperone DnaJ-domain superfamily protein n=1 Tax=Actinidia rufa TaxID=165716 RepID=A0A7J0GGR0_9ERIC|nr:chaperone DnaJ-domain superfamily protein [Actinidia rufa]
MSNLRTICRPHTVFSSIACCCRDRARSRSTVTVRISIGNSNSKPRLSSPSVFSVWFDTSEVPRYEPWLRLNQRRTMVRASNWSDARSPYETLELERDADDEKIKVSYRRLAKFYHPDVYDGRGTLEEGETAEARFIKIQAAYELLMDGDKRKQYDTDNRVNPLKLHEAGAEAEAGARAGAGAGERGYIEAPNLGAPRGASRRRPWRDCLPPPSHHPWPIGAPARPVEGHRAKRKPFEVKSTLIGVESSLVRSVSKQISHSHSPRRRLTVGSAFPTRSGRVSDEIGARFRRASEKEAPIRGSQGDSPPLCKIPATKLGTDQGLLLTVLYNLLVMASQAWMEWIMKKRKAFDQRGDMAIAAWAEQQQRELNLRARRLSRSKTDPEEERRILAKEKKASLEKYNNTLRRHTLVLRRRDIMRRKAEEEKKKVIGQLLAAEGLELETDDDEAV